MNCHQNERHLTKWAKHYRVEIDIVWSLVKMYVSPDSYHSFVRLIANTSTLYGNPLTCPIKDVP